MTIEMSALAAFVSWLSVMLVAAVSWRFISKADPTFARELFTPGLDQAIYKLGPLRWRVLFGGRVPVGLRRWVFVLRAMVVMQIFFSVSFLWKLFTG